MAPLPFFRSDEGPVGIFAHAGFVPECRAVAAWLAVTGTEVFRQNQAPFAREFQALSHQLASCLRVAEAAEKG